MDHMISWTRWYHTFIWNHYMISCMNFISVCFWFTGGPASLNRDDQDTVQTTDSCLMPLLVWIEGCEKSIAGPTQARAIACGRARRGEASIIHSLNGTWRTATPGAALLHRFQDRELVVGPVVRNWSQAKTVSEISMKCRVTVMHRLWDTLKS